LKIGAGDTGNQTDGEGSHRLHKTSRWRDCHQARHSSGDSPRTLGLPLRVHSAPVHPKAAAAAANWVATKALVARLPAANALPALTPNHPTHNMQAPMKLSTTLCGAEPLPAPRSNHTPTFPSLPRF